MIERTTPDFKLLSEGVSDKVELPALLEELYNKGYNAGKIDAEMSWQDRLDQAFDEGYFHCFDAMAELEHE